ncbi:MAG: acyl-CoA reductase [Muribaculaceae bacterium]|nr:acyl-CoA reductase [Muribaculaceae bacterium]
MSDEITTAMDLLFAEPVYSGASATDEAFRKALQEELIFHYEHNDMYRQFCNRKGFDPHAELTSMEQIPSVAVSVFKNLGFGLASVPKEDIKLRLQSSATSGTPSTIVVDKITSRRQAKAMVKVMQEFIGKERKPFLVMDIDPRSEFRALLGARFAAITGYLNFASKSGYFLKAKNGVSYFDIDAIKEYLATLPEEQPVVVFGFTYIMYSNVLKAVLEKGEKLQLPKGSKIIHIGGWKKLEAEKVEKSLFNSQMADAFGIEPTDVIDIYGFTEQMGLNYPDCPCGCKHTSSYVKVLTRDVVTREVLPEGEEGMLEFITPIPHSYPGNVVLTDDMGIIEKEPCPFGRPGQRFRITGRMKKAEVRGCGDILSAKLTFSAKKGDGAADDKHLDVQFFKGTLEGETSEAQFRSIIKQLNEQNAWLRQQPVEALIGLIGMAAKKWLADPRYAFLKDKGLLFLSQWCDERHLRQIATDGLRGNLAYADTFQPCADSDKHFMKANARGLCCHWMAGNVQILGMFALVQCMLTKNVNLLKVAAKDGGVFSSLMEAFEGLEYTTADGYAIKGDDLANTVAVVYFSRHARTLGELMSKEAKVRIAWGGKEAVETVAGYPSSIDCETVIFGPKLSYAVIAKEALSSEQEAKKLARRVSVDVSIFDQAGCASPHNLYVEKGGEVSPERFCEILAEVFPKTEVQIPKPTVSPEQISAIHSIRGVYDFKGKAWGSNNMSWTILLSDEAECELCKPVYSRALMVHEVENINQALEVIEDYIQTIGIEAPLERVVEFADKATAKGVARLPKIGRMLNFEMPWDGVFLIDRLVRWNTLFGPMV